MKHMIVLVLRCCAIELKAFVADHFLCSALTPLGPKRIEMETALQLK